jgi:hypothetical protein
LTFAHNRVVFGEDKVGHLQLVAYDERFGVFPSKFNVLHGVAVYFDLTFQVDDFRFRNKVKIKKKVQLPMLIVHV